MSMNRRRFARTILAAALLPLVTLTACEPGPQPLHVGGEECAHCSMLITERRYATQLVTARGRALSFDSIECMLAYLRTDAVADGAVHSLWVTDAVDGEDWIAAEDATFLRSDGVRSPMGAGLAAYATESRAREEHARLGGELLTWAELRALDIRPSGGGAGHHHGT